MSVILFILGSVVTGAGIVAIGFGIPINEFNLGNTLIVSGTIGFAAGLILIGLAAAVDQLSQIAKALRVRPATRPQPQPAELAAVRPPPPQAPMPAPAPAPAQAKPAAPAPPRNPIFAKAEPPEAEPSSEVSSSAIERLRSSLTRKGGESPAENDAAAPMAPAAPAAAASGSGSNGATPPTNPAGEAPRKPPLDFLFRAKREPQAEPFDAVWPKRGPRRGDEPAPDASTGRTSELLPAADLDEARPTAILKSGVVDGMAYTLYVDGSIEAQLPQGTVRFGSIAELRSHIENNS